MSVFNQRRPHDDFSEELQSHIDLETDWLVAEGMSEDAARAAAHRAFGSVAIANERFYESSRWMWLDQLAQDLRYAWRGMRHSPAFVITTVCTLAVGLGLLTIAFTVFNVYVLRPFAIRDPNSLHQIVWRAREGGGQGFRWRDYDELSRRSDLFSAVIGEHTRYVSSNSQNLFAALVSANYFEALGPPMQIGRGLVGGDASDGAGAVVLSDPAWARLYGRDPSAIGHTIDLNGRAYTIVGVLAPAFIGLGDFPRDVFVPATPPWTTHRPGASESRETEVTVRLRPGVAAIQAATALKPFMNEIIEKQIDVRAEVRPQASPNPVTTEGLVVFSPVFVAFGLVLVAACANVSNMMLARALARHRELAVRLSIGASRGRIVRQLLTEGVLIALMAGLAGLVIAKWGLRAATAALFNTMPPSVGPLLRLIEPAFDHRVFLFALAASAAATLLFALLPALRASGGPLVDALRGGGSTPRGGSRLRNALVCAQVAVALVLVITAVTLARNGASIDAIDIGFATDGVISINVRGDQDDLAGPLAAGMAADPRVAMVAVTSGNPLFNAARIVAAAPAGGALVKPTRITFVSPEFFSTLRLPIAQGRGFRDDEARTAARVAIVASATAAALWPGEDPMGKTMKLGRVEGRSDDELPDYPDATIVGVVRDIVSDILLNGTDSGHIYLPMTSNNVHATAILARGRTDRELTPEALQEIFRRVVPDPQLFEALPLSEMRDLQVYPLMAASSVGSVLGVIALTLSVSGLYGVLTYALNQRRKEIGIRMALGATSRAVVGLVLRQSGRLAGLGIAIGAAITFAMMQALSAAIQLRTITLLDAGAFATGVLVVATATLFAAYRPARHATRIDPSQTLHSD